MDIENIIQVVILTIHRKLKILPLNLIEGLYIPLREFSGTIKHSEPYVIVDIIYPYGENALVSALLVNGLIPIERFLITRDLFALNHLTDDCFRPAEDVAKLKCDIFNATNFV